MPMVPRYDYPQVTPRGSLEVSPSPSHFGAQFADVELARAEQGRAIGRLGGAISQAGDALASHALKMQDRANQAEAKESFFNASMELGKVEAAYRSLEGKAAVDGYPKYVEQVRALREKYNSSMSNIESRRLFDYDFTRRITFSVVDGARYSATQNKKYNVESSNAVIAASRADIEGNPQDDNRFNFNVDTALRASRQRAEEIGRSPEAAKSDENETKSSLYAARIEALSRTDLERAREFYKAHQKEMTLSDQTAVENKFLGVETEAKSQRAVDEFQTKQLVEADLLSIARNGKGVEGIDYEKVKTALGTKTAEAWKANRQVAEGLYKASQGLETLNDEELDQRIASVVPDRTDKNYKVKIDVANNLINKVDEIRKQRIDDPAASVAEDPSVKKAQIAVKQNEPNTVQALMTARMAAQTKAGIVVPSPLTKQEALSYGAPLRMMLPGQERMVLEDLAKKYQTQFGQYADEAFAYSLKALRVDSTTSQMASRMAKRLGLGQSVPPVRTDQQTEVDAAKTVVPSSNDQPIKSPPRNAIMELRRKPDLAAEFDAKYGKGQSEKILKLGKPNG